MHFIAALLYPKTNPFRHLSFFYGYLVLFYLTTSFLIEVIVLIMVCCMVMS